MVLKGAGIINVFTEAVEYADIAISHGKIVGIGKYDGEEELDCTGRFVCPGFFDGHIHLESSMMKPVEFVKAVLPHGTTGVVTDPHEIANVCGKAGITYMLQATQGLPVDIYFAVPSCVPATSFDESGSILKAQDLEEFYSHERVIGLAEVMDYVGTVHGNQDIIDKIQYAKAHNKVVDGHAPGLMGKEACTYILAGIGSDHECVNLEEAKMKLAFGQWIMIREGTAAKNLQALLGLFEPPYHQRAILVSDDKNPYELKEYGHIDDMLRSAIRQGADPCRAIKMATFNTATYFGLKNIGAIAPGYQADLVIFSDLYDIRIEKVMKNGKIVVDDNNVVTFEEPSLETELKSKVYHSFHCKEVVPEDFEMKQEIEEPRKSDHQQSDHQQSEHSDELPADDGIMRADDICHDESFYRIIQFIPGEIVTKEIRLPLIGKVPRVSVEQDILKIAAVERHHNTGHIGLGFVHGYGLKQGAIASSVSHDSHNIIVVGTNDFDMAKAVNCVRNMQGGWAIVVNRKPIAMLSLPIAGLMSELSVEELAKQMAFIKEITRSLGVKEGIDPFMNLAFVSLPVIPKLRLLTTGLFDVNQQRIVSICSSNKI